MIAAVRRWEFRTKEKFVIWTLFFAVVAIAVLCFFAFAFYALGHARNEAYWLRTWNEWQTQCNKECENALLDQHKDNHNAMLSLVKQHDSELESLRTRCGNYVKARWSLAAAHGAEYEQIDALNDIDSVSLREPKAN